MDKMSFGTVIHQKLVQNMPEKATIIYEVPSDIKVTLRTVAKELVNDF